jgi:hypothetical protein
MQLHATLLMNDGSLTSQIVEIPETTPLSEIIRAVAIQLFAEHNISGEVARIGEITLRASASTHAYGAPSTIHAESPALKSVN